MTGAGAPTGDGPPVAERDAPAVLSQAQALAGVAPRGALFAQWGREKRRGALDRRHGEDPLTAFDDAETALDYDPSD